MEPYRPGSITLKCNILLLLLGITITLDIECNILLLHFLLLHFAYAIIIIIGSSIGNDSAGSFICYWVTLIVK